MQKTKFQLIVTNAVMYCISLVVSALVIFILSINPVYFKGYGFIQCLLDMGFTIMMYGRLAFLVHSLLFSFVMFFCLRHYYYSKSHVSWKLLSISIILSFVLTGIKYNSLLPFFATASENPSLFLYSFFAIISFTVLLFCALSTITILSKKGKIAFHSIDISHYRKYKPGLFSSYVSSILAYGFMLTNKLLNHDDIYYLFGHGADTDSGRWGLKILGLIVSDYSMPWLNGILAIFILGLAVVLILDIFHIESKFLQCATASAISVFPSWTGVFYYNFTIIQFSIALFLAVLMVKYANDGKHIICVVLGILMLGIYQAYICVASSLMVVLLIKLILDENSSWKQVLTRSIVYLLYLAVTAGSYFAITLLIQKFSGISFNSYSNGMLNQSISILDRIDIAYSSIIELVINGKDGVFWGKPSVISHAILFIVSLIAGVNCLQNKLKILLFALYGVLLLPLSINGLYIILGPYSIHALTYMGFISMYVLAAITLKPSVSYAARYAIPICLSVIAVCNITYSNIMALKQYMDYENTYAIYTSIITQIQMNEGYTSGTKIAFCGDIPDSNYIGEFNGAVMKANSAIRNRYSIPEFITYYIGFDAEYATDEEKASIMDSPEYSSMPSYPYNGFIKKVGETMVVKFS